VASDARTSFTSTVTRFLLCGRTKPIRSGRQGGVYRYGFSQLAFVHVCEPHRIYVGIVERGEKAATMMTANKIAAARGMDLSRLSVRSWSVTETLRRSIWRLSPRGFA
jgi:hypothetical protein